MDYWPLLKATFSAWSDDKALRLGAALAFYSVLSLSPMLLLVLSAAAAIWGQDAATGQILGQMRDMVGQKGAEAIQAILLTASEHKQAGFVATVTGFGMLLFSASGMFGELQDAMNLIWKVKPSARKPVIAILRDRFFSFAMVMGCGFLLLISLVVSAGLSALANYVNGLFPGGSLFMQAVDFFAGFGIITLIFALTFKTVPEVKIKWRVVWPGAALTAVLFMVGKFLIGLYLSRTSLASSYGAAGSLVVLLLWIYYSAQILFFGAEFTHIYAETRAAMRRTLH
jgi:membrane protein